MNSINSFGSTRMRFLVKRGLHRVRSQQRLDEFLGKERGGIQFHVQAFYNSDIEIFERKLAWFWTDGHGVQFLCADLLEYIAFCRTRIVRAHHAIAKTLAVTITDPPESFVLDQMLNTPYTRFITRTLEEMIAQEYSDSGKIRAQFHAELFLNL